MSTTNPEQNASLGIKPSAIFDDPNADLVFQSCDGVHFRIMSTHLKTTTNGFTVSEHVVAEDDYPIQLQESGEVLELLFQFVHPPTARPENWRQPDVNKLAHDIFFSLAEAAEKYTVFAAVTSSLYQAKRCKTLNHACRHGYNELADKAAKLALSIPIINAASALHPDALGKFIAYRDRWEALIRGVSKELQYTGYKLFCPNQSALLNGYLARCSLDLREAGNLVVKSSGGALDIICSPMIPCRCKKLVVLRKKMAEAAEEIPPFTEIVLKASGRMTVNLEGWAKNSEDETYYLGNLE